MSVQLDFKIIGNTLNWKYETDTTWNPIIDINNLKIRDNLTLYDMIKQIKDLRVKIDGLHQLTKELKPVNINGMWAYNNTKGELEKTDYINSEEINKAADSLILAKAWLGKLLGELGSDNPYSTGKKTIKDIEPTADVANDLKDFPIDSKEWGDNIESVPHIEKVDWLRSEIQSVIDELLEMQIGGNSSSALLRIATENSYTHLCEAKMWLGFEFARIRDNEKSE